LIRRAESRDIAAILTLGKALHAKIGGLPEIDENGSKMLIARALCDRQRILLVGETKGELTGFFFGMVEELFYSKAKYATDVIWFSSDPKNSILMLRSFLRWAKSKQVHHIQMGISSGGDTSRTEQMYERLGFTRIGAHFLRRAS
jgi:hypothetical protein